MAVGPAALARLRKSVRRHLRQGFVRAVFARPGSEEQRTVEGPGGPADDAAIAALLNQAEAAAREGLTKHTYVVDDRTRVQIDARHGAPRVITLDDELVRRMMGGKDRALRPDRSGELLRVIGIMNPDGTISAKHARKYKQISHFVELCRPIWSELRSRGRAQLVRVLDLGCGNAYLTFVIAEALRLEGIPARIVGVDRRDDLVARAQARALELDWDELAFVCGDIASCDAAFAALDGAPDLVVALHACDTATDDALALAIERNAAAILAAPCCQHELAQQLIGRSVDALPAAVLAHGLLRQDFAATLTDAIRVEILQALGYNVDLLEFVDDSHTPKNLLMRAHLRRPARVDSGALTEITTRCATLDIRPRLLVALGTRPHAGARD